MIMVSTGAPAFIALSFELRCKDLKNDLEKKKKKVPHGTSTI